MKLVVGSLALSDILFSAAAFVFTPEMAYVMGGSKDYRKKKEFQLFESLASQAYTVLRRNAQVLETLFLLMTSAGMPELMMESDIM